MTVMKTIVSLTTYLLKLLAEALDGVPMPRSKQSLSFQPDMHEHQHEQVFD